MLMTPPETTSFDQPGAAGYDLSERFEHVKTVMRRVEFQGHLEMSQLRAAVLGGRRRRWRMGGIDVVPPQRGLATEPRRRIIQPYLTMPSTIEEPYGRQPR